MKGFSDRNLSNSTSAQPHPSRGAVGGGSRGSVTSTSGISQSSKSGTKRAKSATKWAKSITQMAKSGIKRTKSEGESAKSGKKLYTKRARTKSVKLPGRQSVRLWIDVPTAFPWRQCLQVWGAVYCSVFSANNSVFIFLSVIFMSKSCLHEKSPVIF